SGSRRQKHASNVPESERLEAAEPDGGIWKTRESGGAGRVGGDDARGGRAGRQKTGRIGDPAGVVGILFLFDQRRLQAFVDAAFQRRAAVVETVHASRQPNKVGAELLAAFAVAESVFDVPEGFVHAAQLGRQTIN